MTDVPKKSAHTGGPWQQKHDFDHEGALTIIGNVDGEYVDGVLHCTYTLICEVDDNEDGLANARLLAAAPELLAAAECALNVLEGHTGGTVDLLRAAIAKATGQST